MAPAEEGQFACDVEGDCPVGWLCSRCDSKCYSNEEQLALSCDGGTACGQPSYTQCDDGDDVTWFDNCGYEIAVQTPCPDTRGVCINLDNRTAQCGCEGNWDISVDCTSCMDHWDMADACNSCLGNWDIGLSSPLIRTMGALM